jgi:hypothetical protein
MAGLTTAARFIILGRSVPQFAAAFKAAVWFISYEADIFG